MKRIKVGFDTWVHLLGMIGVLGGLIFVGIRNAADPIGCYSGSSPRKNVNAS